MKNKIKSVVTNERITAFLGAFALIFFVTFAAITFGEIIGYANNPEFQPYEKQFAIEASKRGINDLRHSKIHFGTVTPSPDKNRRNVAECYYTNFFVYSPNVVVDESYWTGMINSMKEQLIFHELGHCLLLREHGEGIMSPTLLNRQYYEENRDRLIDDLFTGDGK